jgi:UMF1 family MFS transporter
MRAGLRQLKGTVAKLRHQRPLFLFLIASAIYRDGLATLFAVGGLFAAGAFGMDFEEILIFAIGLNVTAAGGSWLFAALTDRVGAKRMVMLGLTGLIVFGTAILFVTDWIAFLVLALILGLFVGPAQSASRVIMAKLAPPSMMTEMFGLYTMTGKAIAFVGPLGFGALTDLFDSQRAGLTVILAMWLLGGALLLFVRVPARDAGADAEPPPT